MRRIVVGLCLLAGLGWGRADADVVRGSQPDPDARRKQWLLLSPWRGEFTSGGRLPEADEGALIADLLRNTKDDRVVATWGTMANDDVPASAALSPDNEPWIRAWLDAFAQWQFQDVVHVVTHGETVQDAAGRWRPFIKLPIDEFEAADAAEWLGLGDTTPEQFAAAYPVVAVDGHAKAGQPVCPWPGLGLFKSDAWSQSHPAEPPIWELGLGEAWFRLHYPPGCPLTNKVIVLSGCQLAKDDALAAYLAGPHNENWVLAFPKNLSSFYGGRAFVPMYRLALASGLPLKSLYPRLTFGFSRRAAAEFVQPKEYGGSLRVREVVRLLDPGLGLDNLTAPKTMTDRSPVGLLPAADGLALPLWLEIDGFEGREAGSADEQGAALSVWLNGQAVLTRQPLRDALQELRRVAPEAAATPAVQGSEGSGDVVNQPVGWHGYRFPLTLRLPRSWERVTIRSVRVVVHLPEGGESRHRVDIEPIKAKVTAGGRASLLVGPMPDDDDGDSQADLGPQLAEAGLPPEVIAQIQAQMREGGAPNAGRHGRLVTEELPSPGPEQLYEGEQTGPAAALSHGYPWPPPESGLSGLAVRGMTHANGRFSVSESGSQLWFEAALRSTPTVVRGPVRDHEGNATLAAAGAWTQVDWEFGPIFLLPLDQPRTYRVALDLDTTGVGLDRDGVVAEYAFSGGWLVAGQGVPGLGQATRTGREAGQLAAGTQRFEWTVDLPARTAEADAGWVILGLGLKLAVETSIPMGWVDVRVAEMLGLNLPPDGPYEVQATVRGRVGISLADELPVPEAEEAVPVG